MFVKSSLAVATALAAAALFTPTAQADVLATPAARHHASPRGALGDLPRRGMSMAQVEQRFGAPVSKLPPAGGDSPRHPTINRWRYSGYTVYFERNRVIHSVPDAAAVIIQR